MRTTRRFAVVTGFVSVLAVPGTAEAQLPAGVTEVASVEGITEYRLENGLRFLLFPDQSKEQITVNITYLVGSRHEGYGETGMAHLLEHLVFKGTPNHPDIPQELTEHGASPNGTTWFDRTNYFETFSARDDVRDENLDWALDLEADRMVNSFIAQEDLDSEMTVVRNEWEAGENSPQGVLQKRILSAAYDWHNYGNSTIGARADIENVPIDRLQAFYRKYYQPDNAILVVAGRFDPDRALELVAEKFGPIPRPERTGANQLFETYTAEPAQDGERTVTLRRVGDVQLAMAAYHMPPGSHEHFAAVDVMTHILATRPAGRLYRALVEPGLAASAFAGNFQLREPGLLFAATEVRRGDSLEEAADVMLATIQALADEPPTEEEVERAKTDFLSNIELAFNNPQGIALQLSEWASMGDWRLFFLHRDRLERVTPEAVHQVAQAYLKRSNRTIGYYYPTDEAPARAEIPAPPDVDALVASYTGREAVAEGEAFDPTIGNIEARSERFELPSGMKVAFLPKENRGGRRDPELLAPPRDGGRADGEGDGGLFRGRHADAGDGEPHAAADLGRTGPTQGAGRRERERPVRRRVVHDGQGEPPGRPAACGRSASGTGIRRRRIRRAAPGAAGRHRRTDVRTDRTRPAGGQPSFRGLPGRPSPLLADVRGTDRADRGRDRRRRTRILGGVLWSARRDARDRGRLRSRRDPFAP